MRKFVSATGWMMLGVVLALALLEIVLRFLPVPMGLYRTQRYDEWPLRSYEPKLPYTYSKSWALRNAHRGMTNNYGHIAPFDFHKDSAPVIVLGDSFVEGLMNAYPETLQGRLGALLGDPQSVYGLGVSGLSISDYLALSRLARDEFKPAAAVVLSLRRRHFGKHLRTRSGTIGFRREAMALRSGIVRSTARASSARSACASATSRSIAICR